MRVAIISNKHSGKGIASQVVQSAKCSLWGWKFDYYFPSSIRELRATCQDLDPSIYQAAIIVGGDGTVNQALPGLLVSKVPLLPFPAGTANDLAGELGITPDWNSVQSLLDHRQIQTMDLIEVNQVPFATVAGIGIGALLTAEFNERRRRSRIFRNLARLIQTQIYTLMSAKTILLSRDYFHKVHVKSDTFDEKLTTAALFICNQASLGGELRLAPPIQNNDCKFNVLIIPRSRSPRLIQALVELKMGRLPKDFILFSTDRLTIRDMRGKPIRVFGDGETLVKHSLLEFKILPKTIQVFRKAAA